MQLLPLAVLFATALPPAPGRLPARVIPFALHQGSIWLAVKVNGSQTLRFELDSGSSVDVIDRQRALALGLPIEERGYAWNAGVGDGMTRLGSVRRVALDIAGLPVQAERVEVLDLSAIARGKGRAMDGMVGATLFDRFVVAIDYAGQTLSLWEPDNFVYEGAGESLPLRPLAGTLRLWTVRAELVIGLGEPIEGEFIIDTPVALPAVVSSGFARDNQLLSALRLTGAGTSELVGVGGTSRAWLGKVDELRLGSLSLPTPAVALANAPRGVLAGHRVAGVIGGGALSHFRVIVDCPHRRLILEPRPVRAAPVENAVGRAVVP
jgi:hypothetical protein